LRTAAEWLSMESFFECTLDRTHPTALRCRRPAYAPRSAEAGPCFRPLNQCRSGTRRRTSTSRRTPPRRYPARCAAPRRAPLPASAARDGSRGKRRKVSARDQGSVSPELRRCAAAAAAGPTVLDQHPTPVDGRPLLPWRVVSARRRAKLALFNFSARVMVPFLHHDSAPSDLNSATSAGGLQGALVAACVPSINAAVPKKGRSGENDSARSHLRGRGRSCS